MFKIFCVGFFSFQVFSSPLEVSGILNVQTKQELDQLVGENKKKNFLENLCQQQKTAQKIPSACYELGLPADPWCLGLKLEDLRQMKDLKKALKSGFLSSDCQNHLKQQEKILEYRQKDFFLPGLKNYFTVEKPFF